MKRLLAVVLAGLISVSLIGCQGLWKEYGKDIENTIRIEEKQQENKDDSISVEIRNSIEETVSNKEEAVNEKDIEKYMKTVNNEDSEYYAEQKHWFQDILINEIVDYSLKVTSIEEKDDNSYLVGLIQKYTYKGKKSTLRYKVVYNNRNNRMIDCDLDFKLEETEHFIIKYTEKSKKLVQQCSKAAEEAYGIVAKNYGIVPKDKTVIKIYDNTEVLRQFVKLSFQWDMAGWYEYSESIKYIGMGSQINSESLAHELIHKVTIGESNNNMPYWFSEGLATHYSGNTISNLENKISIEQMQDTNLEELTDKVEIYNYYESAQMAVEFIINKYGEEKLRSAINELSRYPFEDKTGSEVDKKNIEIFNDVVKKVIGKSIQELDGEFKL